MLQGQVARPRLTGSVADHGEVVADATGGHGYQGQVEGLGDVNVTDTDERRQVGLVNMAGENRPNSVKWISGSENKFLPCYSGCFGHDRLRGQGGHETQSGPVISEVEQRNDPVLRPREEHVPGVVHVDLDDGILLVESGVDEGGHEEGEGRGGVVDLDGLLAEPAVVGLVGELVETPVLAAEEDPSGLSSSDRHHVHRVGGQRVQRLWKQSHFRLLVA